MRTDRRGFAAITEPMHPRLLGQSRAGWEYLFLKLPSDEINAKLNELAGQGWEVVTFTENGSFLLRRER